MNYSTISIPSSHSTERLNALAEVDGFATTDMGFPGQGPWVYRVLTDSQINTELAEMSHSRTVGDVDFLTFQPCSPSVAQNQDRIVVQKWEMPNGLWSFSGLFDGHLNNDTVDFISHFLPQAVKKNLQEYLSKGSFSIDEVSEVLKNSVIQTDENLSADLLDIFPLSSLLDMSDKDIRDVIDRLPLDRRDALLGRCIGGTTVLISILDPTRTHLWVVNLGDSTAVLGYGVDSHGSVSVINSTHSMESNLQERQRILSEHPGEVHVVEHNRILGFLEPTRAIGDLILKLPSAYSRVFSNMEQDYISKKRLRELASKITTPPYVSNTPDIYHEFIGNTAHFLLLASDGLEDADEYFDMSLNEKLVRWGKIIGDLLAQRDSRENIALPLLKDCLGGKDTHRVSRNMTVEMDEKWMDDITIIVQRFNSQ